MLTPVFFVRQDDQHIIVEIRAPYAKVTEAEAHAAGTELYFACAPYTLHLHLGQPLDEGDTESATYDADTGTFTVYAKKRRAGEHFTGLDLITELLRPKGADRYEGVAEIGDNASQEQSAVCHDSLPTCSDDAYGFASTKSGVFEKLREEIGLLLELRMADTVDNSQRVQFDKESTIDAFNVDHYLADLHEPEDGLDAALDFVPWWRTGLRPEQILDERTRCRLKDLPRHKLAHVPAARLDEAFRSLFDVLFGYAYDVRTTDGEHNCESGWTVQRLSATLSCLSQWATARQPVVSCVRRALALPLHRHWRLAALCVDDVRTIVALGKAAALRCVVRVHELFAGGGDYRYVLNDLYITDYCLALQQTHCDSAYNNWASELLALDPLRKNELGLDLENSELQAEMSALSLSGVKGDLDSDDEPN